MSPLNLFGVLWTKSTFSYGLLAFAISLLHSVYVSLYTDYYLRAQRFDLGYFAIGQLVYGVWNSLNDLGFGFWNDTSLEGHVNSRGGRRTAQIRRGGPLWAVSFACLWLPLGRWLHPALQYTAMMVVYDGFFSYTTVAFRALLADMSQTAKEREDCNVAAAVFHFVAAGYVGVASYFYDQSPTTKASSGGTSSLDLTSFRYFTVVTAIISSLVFRYATQHITEQNKYHHQSSVDIEEGTGSASSGAAVVGGGGEAVKKEMTLKEFVGDTFGHRRHQQGKPRGCVPVLMLVWFLQEYSCSFATNFFPLFLSMSTASYFSSTARACILVLSFATPHVVTVFVTTPLIRRQGRKKVLSGLFFWRLVVAIVALMQWRFWGGTNSFPLALGFTALLLLNRVLTEAVCRLQPLIAADAIDEDYLQNHRSVTMGGAIHGLLALASKPAQSLVPVIGCFYLLYHNISMADSGGTSSSATHDDTHHQDWDSGSSSAIDAHSLGVIRFFFAMTCIVTSASLWVVWRRRYGVSKEVEEFHQRHQVNGTASPAVGGTSQGLKPNPYL